MRKKIATLSAAVLLLTFGIGFGGCSAMNTAMKKSELAVESKLSQSVFLEPVSSKEKIVFVDIKNTSNQEMNVKNRIESALVNRGYRLTDDPKEARFMIQGNVLKVDKTDPREAKEFANSGFGSAVSGAAIGAATAYALGGGNKTMVAAGLAGAAISMAADAVVEDVMYVMITDLQVRERPLEGEVVTQTQKSTLAQGESTTIKQSVSGAKSEWKTYQTRVVSTANKANLAFEEAKPVLESELSRVISGIF
ncbi:MAG: Conjugal transfer protein TraT [Campylobacterota bacterium]|nr:Conjugal transfer protein TraT [Campylobacterota bacterium]